MKIKKVQADTVKNAMAQIRKEFGSEAVILNTRNLTKPPEDDPTVKVEVTAGVYEDDRATEPKVSAPKSQQQPTEPRGFSKQQKSESLFHEDPNDMRDAMRRMQEMIERLTVDLQHPEIQSLPEQYRDWYLYLVKQEVDSYLVKTIIKDALKNLGRDVSADDIKEHLEAMIEEIFLESSSSTFDEQKRIVAIVGPTGVGKTTTIAKLATQKSLEEGLSVALITADTYRVAATDQLRMFANLLEVPMEVVYTPEEMKKAIKKYQEFDYIFIDTTGRSQNDEENIQQIYSTLQVSNPDEIHLVLSATTSGATIRSTANKFSILPITDLIVTKTDEAVAIGSILALLQQYSWSISYFSNGQNVPEDLMVGSPAGYSKLLFANKE